MFLCTGGHVTKFAAWRFFLVTRVTPSELEWPHEDFGPLHG